MEIEQLEIFDFMSVCHPLNKLTEEQIRRLVKTVEITYYPRGSVILNPGDKNSWLYLIRTGAVTRTDSQDGLIAQFASKDFFGHRSIERGGVIKNKVRALEDSLFYLIPAAMYQKLMHENLAFHHYFSQDKKQRLQSAMEDLKPQTGNILVKSRVRDFIQADVLTVEHDASIALTAELMTAQNKTSALVMKQGQLAGIVTDRAFCTRVVAENRSRQASVESIMTPHPVCISPEQTGLEAMQIMTRRNIRHLPVVVSGKIHGMITATDLIHHQSNNPFYLVNEIHKATTVASLLPLSEEIPASLVKLVATGMHANDIAYSISTMGRAIMKRVIQLAVQELGEPPIAFAYIAAGSLARNDQTAHSDQDNALILDDSYNEEQHGSYFRSLAKRVSDGLNQCGYVYCPGDVMATNSQWRQTLAVWKTYFHQWIHVPEPRALMYASIFFDLRCIYGEQSLLDQLHDYVNQQIAHNRMFLGFMAANARQQTPPLGLFRRFVLETHGAEKKFLDIKKRGIMPCTDIARVFALDAQLKVINTAARISGAAEASVISSEAAGDLRDAYEFLSWVRLQHQSLNIQRGQEPNNHVNPEELSSLERRHLKDAFEIVRTYQEVLSHKYSHGQL